MLPPNLDIERPTYTNTTASSVCSSLAASLRVNGALSADITNWLRPSTVRSDEWPAWFSFWFSGCWRAFIVQYYYYYYYYYYHQPRHEI